jgi:hypothetical protein
MKPALYTAHLLALSLHDRGKKWAVRLARSEDWSGLTRIVEDG